MTGTYGIDRTSATRRVAVKTSHTGDAPRAQKRETPRHDLVRSGWRQTLPRHRERKPPVGGNIQKTPQIKLSDDENFKGTARFFRDRTEQERAIAAIRRKYWMFRPILALGHTLSAKGLMRDNTGSFEVTLAR